MRLKHYRARAESLPQGAATQGSVLPEQDGCCSMGDDSGSAFQCLLSVLSPKLPSPVFPLASLAYSGPTFAGAQGKWLQMKISAMAL